MISLLFGVEACHGGDGDSRMAAPAAATQSSSSPLPRYARQSPSKASIELATEWDDVKTSVTASCCSRPPLICYESGCSFLTSLRVDDSLLDLRLLSDISLSAAWVHRSALAGLAVSGAKSCADCRC